MKHIKEFIDGFISQEFTCNKSEYDLSVSDDEYNASVNELITFNHSLTNHRSSARAISKEYSKYFDEEDLKLYAQNSEKAIPRTLFLIKQYKNSELGDALKRIVTGDELYACYTSYPSKGSRELYFSSIFYIAETNEGLKVIYEKSFDSDTGKWYHPVDMDVTTVISEGELVAVEKYQPPVEATSLADYNDD